VKPVEIGCGIQNKREVIEASKDTMSFDPSDNNDWAVRWDQLYKALSAEPRRMIISSLLDEPEERRLPLPDAAESPNRPMDAETLCTQLRHHHLPLLADAGYVRWEPEPFVVQRGPRFEEPACIIELVTDTIEELPTALINNCKIFQNRMENA
jgi:DNA-binding transcriptional ArsR family regulator